MGGMATTSELAETTKLDGNMKVLYIQYAQCTTRFSMFNDGKEFIAFVDSNEEAYNKVANIEQQDWFTQDDGTITDQNGREVFDPTYPDRFEFGDFTYYAKDIDSLDEYYDDVLIKLVEENK